MTQDIDKNTDRLITSEQLAKDARLIMRTAGELMQTYCTLLGSDDHAIVDGVLDAITSLRKIAMQGHNMLTASETVADADRIDNLKAVITRKYDDEDGE